MAWTLNLLMAWAILWLVVHLVSEYGQNFLYDQTVDGLWWRSLTAGLLLATLMLLLPPDDLLARLLNLSVLALLGLIFQVAAWHLVFWLLCGFQPNHAVAVGVGSFALFAWIVPMAVASLQGWLARGAVA